MYEGTRDIFKLYWTAYGGTGKLLRSPYLHFAALILALTWNTWWAPQCGKDGACSGWWEQNISVLPNLLGFTLGGFAIFIGFGDEKFRGILADPDPKEQKQPVKTEQSQKVEPNPLPNLYVGLCASFVHFILVQAIALLFAIVAKSWWFYAPFMDPIRGWLPVMNTIAGAIGYGLFLYALTCVLAATMHVFRIAKMYARFRSVTATAQTPSQQQSSPKQMQ